MNWLERQLDRLRSLNPLVVDGALAVLFTVLGVATVFGQDIHDDRARSSTASGSPSAWLVVTALVTCAPVAVRRRWPLLAPGHLVARDPRPHPRRLARGLAAARRAVPHLHRRRVVPDAQGVAGLAVVSVAIVVLALGDSPGLDAVGVLGVIAQFAAVWAIGVALRSRRAATDARVREADERAEAERQSAARVLAEERLRIAQELHDVVAHSMSVIAVQAGVGAHVLDERPEQARAALEAISATSRGTLTEMRRLLGVLRDSDGVRSQPRRPVSPTCRTSSTTSAPPACRRRCTSKATADCVHAGVELSAYRIVQEALTNVIKHAGKPTRVDVTVRYPPGSLAVEVVDDGRGVAAQPATATPASPTAPATA